VDVVSNYRFVVVEQYLDSCEAVVIQLQFFKTNLWFLFGALSAGNARNLCCLCNRCQRP